MILDSTRPIRMWALESVLESVFLDFERGDHTLEEFAAMVPDALESDEKRTGEFLRSLSYVLNLDDERFEGVARRLRPGILRLEELRSFMVKAWEITFSSWEVPEGDVEAGLWEVEIAPGELIARRVQVVSTIRDAEEVARRASSGRWLDPDGAYCRLSLLHDNWRLIPLRSRSRDLKPARAGEHGGTVLVDALRGTARLAVPPGEIEPDQSEG